MIIAPQKDFLVDYYINNPADTSTYWVRAIIVDSVSGNQLASLDLDVDSSGKYFSKKWYTPMDSTGRGRQIKIFKTVYEDAYITESPNYGTSLENYVIQNIPLQNAGGFTREYAQASISAKQIEDAVRKVLGEQEKVEPKEIVFPADRTEELLSELEELHEKLEAVNEHFTVIESQTGEGFASTTEWLGNYTDKVFKSIATKIDEKNKELRKEIFARIDAHKPLNNTKEIQDYVSASIAHIENLMKQKEEVENSNKEKAESLLSELKENITEMIDEIRNPKEKEEPKGKWDDAIEELLGKQNKQKPQGRWDEQILKLV